MIPSDPQRPTPIGFLYLPPFRVQGVSIAGEESWVQVPELDVCFDIGRAPRTALTSTFVALTHGHMDHSAGVAYYFSQRNFQGMDKGTILCHKTLEHPLNALMKAWIDIEGQRTPHQIIGMENDQEIEIKNTFFLRAFDTLHTMPSLGYAVIEKRSKLLPELAGLPQEKILELKKQNRPITHMVEIPHVVYTGDTSLGAHFDRPDVRNAKILITECTFIEEDHFDRSRVGRHLHVRDLVEILKESKAEAVVITHLSRRTHMQEVRQEIEKVLPASEHERVFLLMDHRANHKRYQQQMAAAEKLSPTPVPAAKPAAGQKAARE